MLNETFFVIFKHRGCGSIPVLKSRALQWTIAKFSRDWRCSKQSLCLFCESEYNIRVCLMIIFPWLAHLVRKWEASARKLVWEGGLLHHSISRLLLDVPKTLGVFLSLETRRILWINFIAMELWLLLSNLRLLRLNRWQLHIPKMSGERLPDVLGTIWNWLSADRIKMSFWVTTRTHYCGFFMEWTRLLLDLTSSTTTNTVFENHRKSLIRHCERSELCLRFEWKKIN